MYRTCHLPLFALKSLKEPLCHFKGRAALCKQNTELPLGRGHEVVKNDRMDCLYFIASIYAHSVTIPKRSLTYAPSPPGSLPSFLRVDCIAKGSLNGNLRMMIID